MRNKGKGFTSLRNKGKAGCTTGSGQPTAGLLKPSMLLESVCQFGERAEEEAKNTGHKRKDKGSANTVNVRVYSN